MNRSTSCDALIVKIGPLSFAQLTLFSTPKILCFKMLFSWPDTPHPQHCLFTCGDLDPHLIRGSLDLSNSEFQTASRSVQPFCTAHGSVQWAAPFPFKISPSHEWIEPHLIRRPTSLGRRESTFGTASRFSQSCGAHGRSRQTDRQTTLFRL